MNAAATLPPDVAAAAAAFDHLSPVEQLRQSGITILDLFDNVPWFRGAADWTAWRAFICALYALPMTDQEFDIYVECTGRKDPPKVRATQAWVPTGRRGRKSAIGSLVAVERALLYDYTVGNPPPVAPGQRPLIPILADKKENAATIMSFVRGILTSAPALRGCLQGEPGAEKVELTSGVDIVVRAASLTAGRSPAVPCGVLDEIAFWPTDDSAQPDHEIVRAIEPAMATFENPLLLALSSPYAKRGMLWEAYRDHYGENGPILVWKAPTLRMHDSPVVRAYVAAKTEEDPVSASAEFGAEFRADISSPFDDAVIAECTEKGVTERPHQAGVTYCAFADPSGGSSDSFGLSIAHWDGVSAVQDVVAEWKAPYQPRAVVQEAIAILKRYGITVVEGDRYGGEWPAERFRDGLHDATCSRSRIEAAPCTCEPWKVAYGPSELSKNDIYLQLIPLVNDRRVRFVENRQQRVQLAALERRTARGGRDSIDHPPNGHDDVANAGAGALVKAARLQIAPQKVKREATNPREMFTDRLNELMRARLQAGARRSQMDERGGDDGVSM